MPWLMFALAILSFVLLCYAHSLVLGVLWALLVIGFFGAGALRLIATQVGSASRDTGHILTPEEIRAYREQAQARKQAQTSATTPEPPSSSPG